MRTIVDIPDDQVLILSEIGKQEGSSRAEIIRQAIASYIQNHKHSVSIDDAFGLWKDRKINGLEYQKDLRSEWNH